MEFRMFEDDFSEAIFSQIIKNNIDKEISDVKKNKEKITVSQTFLNKMDKVFALDKRKTRITHILKTTKKVGLSAAVCITVFSFILLTQPEVRASVKSVFVKWFGTHTNFTTENGNDSDFKSWNITALSADYTAISEEKANDLFSAIYMNEENIIVFNYCLENSSLSVNNENVDFSQITDNDITYYIFTAKNSGKDNSVVWDYDGYRFCISGNISSEELLSLAKSVQ